MTDNRTETPVLSDALISLTSDPRCFAYRNNTGTAFTRSGAMIRFGLIGSGDIMGCVRRVITPDMVGREYGQAFAVETKSRRGTQRITQQHFESAWTLAGGLYVLARTPETAIREVLQC